MSFRDGETKRERLAYSGLQRSLLREGPRESLCRRRVLGDGFGAFADGVLAEFAGQDEADGGLDFARSERLRVVVAAQVARFMRDTLEDVVDERVHDRLHTRTKQHTRRVRSAYKIESAR